LHIAYFYGTGAERPAVLILLYLHSCIVLAITRQFWQLYIDPIRPRGIRWWFDNLFLVLLPVARASAKVLLPFQ